jgi:hypothetical protein
LSNNRQAARAAREYAEGFGRLVNATISKAPMALVRLPGAEFQGFVAHCASRKFAKPMPLTNGNFLYVYQQVGVRDDLLTPLDHTYTYQATEDDESWIFRYEYLHEQEPGYEYPTAHLHVNAHPDFYDGPRPFPALHLPTNYVTLESVIRHLVVEHQLGPISTNWESVLENSENEHITRLKPPSGPGEVT